MAGAHTVVMDASRKGSAESICIFRVSDAPGHS
jgi:hypothetical protein